MTLDEYSKMRLAIAECLLEGHKLNPIKFGGVEMSETEFDNPKKTGVKHDKGKAPMELLDYQALKEIAEVFGYGEAKYGRHNFRDGLDWSRVIGAAYRHLGEFNSGVDLDDETKKKHLAHLGCCVLMLLEYTRTHPELDDRYKPNK